MNVVFMGTPDFSAKVLERLNRSFAVCAVVTGEDKEIGRGHKIVFSALKSKAIELGIPVLQFANVSKDGIEQLKGLKPDVIVTAAFGQMLSQEFLDIPTVGVFNVHASLLPKYRGASPIQSAILNGEDETGVTIMRTVKKMDAGDIICVKKTKINDDETAGELFDRLSEIGGEAIVEAISQVADGTVSYVPQDEQKATYCKMLTKEFGRIDFGKTARELNCFVRGCTPFPTAYTFVDGKLFKIFKVEAVQTECANVANGQVLTADSKNGLVVACNGGAVRLCEVQIENGKRMSDVAFLLGRKIQTGTIL